MTGKKKFAGQGWTTRDAAFVGLVAVVLLLSAGDPRFLVALLAPVARLAVLFVKGMRRARIGRENAKVPFWTDRIKD